MDAAYFIHSANKLNKYRNHSIMIYIHSKFLRYFTTFVLVRLLTKFLFVNLTIDFFTTRGTLQVCKCAVHTVLEKLIYSIT